MTDETFKRGQVEWALWRAFVAYTHGAPKDDVPDVFRTRIKRLLELDRSGDLFEAEVPPEAAFAFAESATEGTGIDVAFTVLDAWCLGIALDLLDAGFKQKEITFLMRYLRGDLAKHLPNILANAPGGRQLIHPKNRPNCPTYRLNRVEFADCHVFLIVRKIEISEIVPSPSKTGKRKAKGDQAPWFLEPIFCAGYDDLRNRATQMPLNYRKAMVLEIAQLADDIRRFLAKAPEIRRGRQ